MRDVDFDLFIPYKLKMRNFELNSNVFSKQVNKIHTMMTLAIEKVFRQKKIIKNLNITRKSVTHENTYFERTIKMRQ